MRILHLCPTMYEAGTWFRCLHLARGLAARGHDATSLRVRADRRGTHHELHWRRRLPAALRFLFPA